ncbi:MAG: MFS transporter, partial [Actinobacteria bacterium]|nr:MFS transporter [Actinomycetota bacterium]
GLAVGPIEIVVALLAAAQLVGLFASSLFNVNGPSLRQALTAPHLLGRVNASYRFLVWGTGPIGALLGGVLGEVLGLRTALLVTGLASIVVLPIFITSPLMAQRDMPSPHAY